LVVTELMYHPTGTNDEFIELMNIGDVPLPLDDPAHPQNTWRIAGVDFNFPQAIELAAREIVLVVPVDPATFRARYSIDPEIRIFGPYTGALSNGGELIRVRKPDEPTLVGGIITLPYIDIDSVNYSDRAPWPALPDGLGPSLERIDPTGFADDPTNWRASDSPGGTPGTVEFAEPPSAPYDNWLAAWELTGDDALPLADPDKDGIANLLEYGLALIGPAPAEARIYDRTSTALSRGERTPTHRKRCRAACAACHRSPIRKRCRAIAWQSAACAVNVSDCAGRGRNDRRRRFHG
jgi:hypothetical protein